MVYSTWRWYKINAYSEDIGYFSFETSEFENYYCKTQVLLECDYTKHEDAVNVKKS